jgi:DNA-binding SARP family transcriptional activator
MELVSPDRPRLRALGELRLTRGDEELLPGRRKVLALLAYVAAQSPRPIGRAELAALFWGERGEAQARQSLRQALRELRGALGERIEVSTESVAVAAAAIDLDVASFHAELAAGRPAAAVERWSRGGLLAGCDDLGTAEFRDWLDAERERLRRLGIDALQRLAAAAEQRGEWADAVGWLERWVEHEPWSEPANTQLILALRLAGRPDRAAGVHAAAVACIRAHFGEEPSAEFLRLAGAAVAPARRAPRPEPRSAALLTPDLVGRGEAFGRLADAWARVCGGGAATLLVEGEEGVGKTRLCEEFLRWVEASGPVAKVLRARAFAAEKDLDGALVRDLLAGLADAPGVGGAPDDALAAVAAWVPTLRDRYPRLPAARTDPSAGIEALRRVLGDVAAEVPLVLFADDLPAADPESLRLVLALARRLPAGCLLLVAASTADPGFAETTAPLRGIPGVERVPIAPIDAAGVEALLDSMLPIAPEPRRSLAPRLHAETGGNPLYVVALVSALADSGLLRRDSNGVWDVAMEAGGALPLPPGVREVVEERLRHLSAPAHEVLGAAAVVGSGIDPAVLERMVAQQPDEFCDAVEELIARRFLRLAASRQGHYEFSHDLIRRVAFERLGPARQSLLQRSLREALEPSAPTEPATAPSPPPPAIAATERRAGGELPRGPTRKIRRRAAAFLLLALAIVGVSGIMAFGSRAAPAVSGSLGVLPFDYRGSEEHRYLGEGLADLLSVRLDGAGELSSVDPRVLLGAVARNGQRGMDRERARSLAARFGAEFYVLGSVVESRGRLQVHASLHGLDGEAIASASALAESEAGVPELVDDLARQLLAGRVRGSGAALARTAAVTTASLPALRFYLDGERLLREGRFGDASTAFAAATEADSTFALAHYRLGVALEWAAAEGSLIAAATDAAVRHADRLPARARLLVEAADARRRGLSSRADSIYQGVLRLSRNDFEAEFHLAEIRFHDRPVRGTSFTSSKPHWERVLALDPGNGFALVHLARIAAVEDSLGAFLDRHAAAVDAVPREDRRGIELALWRAIRAGGSLPRGLLDAPLRDGTFVPVGHIVGYSRDLAATERLLRELREALSHDRFEEVHLANVLAAQGRFRAADSLLASSGSDEALWRFSFRGFLPLLAPGLSFPWGVRGSHQDLLRWTAREHQGPIIRAYLLGMAEAALGLDAPSAGRVAELERVPDSPLAHDLALTIRAEAARRQGRTDEALRLFASARLHASWDQSFNSPFHSRAHLRWAWAETLREAGRDAAASGMFASLGEASPYEIVLVAPAHLRRAEIHDRRGERADALRHYRRFAEMWKDADADLQPHVSRARERIRAVEAGRR